MEDQRTMDGRTCLITGSTSGLGEATATALARMGAHVIIAGPTEQDASSAAARVKESTSSKSVDYVFADLSSQREVRRLADEIKSRFPRLDVLMNNAGIISNERQESVDGIELTWATNYLSAFLLTNLLVDTLRTNAPARVINVSSVAHRRATLDFDDLGFQHGYRPLRAYRRSKLALLLFTIELARRFPPAEITSNAVHPGVVLTGLGKTNGVIAGAIKWVYYIWGRRNMVTPEKGAETGILLASSPDVANVTGKYFVDKKVTPTSARAADPEIARKLWQVSERMTGLSKSPV